MCPARRKCWLRFAVVDTDAELLHLRLAYHEAMVVKLQDSKPELALIWLAGADILRKRLQSVGVDLTQKTTHALT